MDNKDLNMRLIPLYKFESNILIGLKEDYVQSNVKDGLVIEIDMEKKQIITNPWSGQKKLKFGYYYPLNENEKQVINKEINGLFSEMFINEIIDLLLNPSKEAIDSLIWIPERLKNKK